MRKNIFKKTFFQKKTTQNKTFFRRKKTNHTKSQKSSKILQNPIKFSKFPQNFPRKRAKLPQTKHHLNTTRRLYNHPRTTENHQNTYKIVLLALRRISPSSSQIPTPGPRPQGRPPNHRKSQKSFKIHENPPKFHKISRRNGPNSPKAH